jgi:hypothetical protein
MTSKVYAPQQPSRYDGTVGEWLPTVNLTHAKRFGELVVMLPPDANRLHSAPLLAAIEDKMRDFTHDDWLIAVGDPTMIAMCAIIAHRKTGMLRILKWDRVSGDYLAVEMKL